MSVYIHVHVHEHAPNLFNVLCTFADVVSPVLVLGVVGVDEDRVVGAQSQLHHLPAKLWQVG